ncbi:peptidoglycan-binding domain-containing protein [Roseovarius nubinhibens]|uniref:peptidoglycan-binding domain-containing protein n=1 Tax=Roseovarius nubinhibens TaxID=314263 RepID=UPI0030EB287E
MTESPPAQGLPARARPARVALAPTLAACLALAGSLLPLTSAAQAQTTAESATDLTAELAQIEAELAALEASVTDATPTPVEAALRDALRLSQTLLRNRQLALDGAAPLEATPPALTPDPARADRLMVEMARARARIATAERELRAAEGLIATMVQSRLETERLTLAGLRMGWLSAKYGISFPMLAPAPTTPGAAPQPDTAPAASASAPAPSEAATDTGPPVWADPEHPEIDYRLAPFELAHATAHQISGWWTIETGRAAVDDSPEVTAINYSAYDPRDLTGLTALVTRCTEGETALIYVQDDYLIPDLRRNSFDVTLRIGTQAARSLRWSGLTTNKGAGVFGEEAEEMIRAIYDAGQVFLRITERNGRTHDALFSLAGQTTAFEAVANACGFTTVVLSSDDYHQIQALLNKAGFEAGKPDGQWGPGSRRAMRAFQQSKDLPQTGAPDRASLDALGFGG